MRWVLFSDLFPLNMGSLITRREVESGDLLESWPIWDESFLDCDMTHWWDGEYDLSCASLFWDTIFSEHSIFPEDDYEKESNSQDISHIE